MTATLIIAVTGLLVCAVPFIAEMQQCVSRGRIRACVMQPESRKAMSFEGISVSDSPVQVDRSRPCSDVGYFIDGKGTIKPNCFVECPATTKSQRKAFLQWLQDERIFLSDWYNSDLSDTKNFVRWGLPGVLDGQYYTRDVRFGWLRWVKGSAIKQPSAFRQDVSPQLASASSNHDQDGENQSTKLKKRGNRSDDSDSVTDTPKIVWLAWSLAVAVLGFILCLIGGQYLDDNRRLLGAALLAVGLLLGALGFLIWWPTYTILWHWTWGRIL